MNNYGRTYQVIKNTSITFLCQMVYLIMSFVCRTVFAKSLGTEYLGVSGLFTNILTILSFAELGIGSALAFRMYKPLAKHDIDKLNLYVHLYKRVYIVITVIIAVVGLSIIPILPNIVNAPDIKENITLIYVLYLLQTLVSYIYVYKKSLLIADQKNYIVNLYTQVFSIIMNILQCVFLIITHDFVLYCVLNILCNLANNITCSIDANRRYPFLKNHVVGKLDQREVKELFTDVKGLFLTKIASVAFSGTDNIFIAVFIGIKSVGILSTYTLILSTINSITNKVFDSITASIGNLVVSDEREKTEDVLKKLFFLNTSMYGYVCIGMLLLLRQFVKNIWLSNEYDLSFIIVMFVLIELFFRSIHYPLYITRNAMGSFSEHKGIFACMALVNILLDFILVKPLGIEGLYLATILCRGITYIIDIWVVYKEQLCIPIWNHFRMLLKWVLFLAICGTICNYLIKLVPGDGIISFIVRGCEITVIYFLLFFFAFSKSSEYIYYRGLLKSMLFNKGDQL